MDFENEAFGLARVRINEVRISEGLLYYKLIHEMISIRVAPRTYKRIHLRGKFSRRAKIESYSHRLNTK